MTVNELKEACDMAIAEGYGDKAVIISGFNGMLNDYTLYTVESLDYYSATDIMSVNYKFFDEAL